MNELGLATNRKISNFSKGMKRQLSLIIGVATQRKYLICDETFDGLDPVMRQAVKGMFAKEMADHELTPILSSHNLRELEDVCDHVGLLHKGGVLLSKDLEDMKCNIQKVQCVFKELDDAQKINNRSDVILHEKRGKVHIYTIRGAREDVEAMFQSMNMVFYEVLPLSLEEIFISETEVVGYDIQKCIIG
jgi:ABC-2 type transport system ATP-binding protein